MENLTVAVTNGVPQASELSTLLFSIYLSYIDSGVNHYQEILRRHLLKSTD